MNKSVIIILVIIGILFTSCICAFSVAFILKSNPNTTKPQPTSESDTAVVETNAINTKDKKSTGCLQDYDMDSTKWTSSDFLDEAGFSIKYPSSFSIKANDPQNYELRGSSISGCQHFLHISFGDYPVAPKCSETVESYKANQDLVSDPIVKQGSKLGGFDSCEFDYQIMEGTKTSYRKFVTIYRGTRYYTISAWAYDQKDMAVYEKILGSMEIK